MPSTDPANIEKEMRERIEKEISERRRKDEPAAPANAPAPVKAPWQADAPAAATDAASSTPTEPAKSAETAVPTPPAAETPEERKTRMEAEIRARLNNEITERLARPGSTTPAAAVADTPAETPTDKAAASATSPTKEKKSSKGKNAKTSNPKAGNTKTKGGKTGIKSKSTATPKVSTSTRSGKNLQADSHIAAEKAKIDAKLRKRQRILYAMITGSTLIILGVLIYRQMNKAGGPAQPALYPPSEFEPETATKRSNPYPTQQRPTPAPTVTIDTIVANAITAAENGDPAGAVKTLKDHAAQTPKDTKPCYDGIARICESYQDGGNVSIAWMNIRDSVQTSLESRDPKLLRKAMVDLQAFQAAGTKDAFLAELPLLQAATTLYDREGSFASTGALNTLPDDVPSPWNAAGDDSPALPPRGNGGNGNGGNAPPTGTTPPKPQTPPRSNDGEYIEFNFDM